MAHKHKINVEEWTGSDCGVRKKLSLEYSKTRILSTVPENSLENEHRVLRKKISKHFASQSNHVDGEMCEIFFLINK